MRKVWLIVKREYGARLMTKGFVFGTIAVPILSIGLMVFSIFLATRLTDRTGRWVVSLTMEMESSPTKLLVAPLVGRGADLQKTQVCPLAFLRVTSRCDLRHRCGYCPNLDRNAAILAAPVPAGSGRYGPN